MPIVLRSLLLIGLYLYSLPVSAQWERRIWIDELVERAFPTVARTILADPGHVAAEFDRFAADSLRVAFPAASAAASTRVPPPWNAAFAVAAAIPGEYNANAYFLDRLADDLDQIPPRYSTVPVIVKPGKIVMGNPAPDSDATPPAREPREGFNLDPVHIPGKPEQEPPKEPRESWSTWNKPQVEIAPETESTEQKGGNPPLDRAAIKIQPSSVAECEEAYGGYGNDAHDRCVGRVWQAQREEIQRKSRPCQQAHGYGTVAYHRCTGDGLAARVAQDGQIRMRCEEAHGYATDAFNRCYYPARSDLWRKKD